MTESPVAPSGRTHAEPVADADGRAHRGADRGADPHTAADGQPHCRADSTADAGADRDADARAYADLEPVSFCQPQRICLGIAERSPAPEPTDEGTGGLLPWVVGIGLLGGGAAAIYFWYRSNQTPPDDGLGPDGEPLPDGGGAIEDSTPGAGPGAAAAARVRQVPLRPV